MNTTNAGSNSTISIEYSDCVHNPKFFPGYQLKANGSATGETTSMAGNVTTSIHQNISYSGDLGFASDCDYTVTLNNAGPSYAGSCTYVDSADAKLSIEGDEMTQAVKDLLNNGLP